MTDFRAWAATLPAMEGRVRVEGAEIVLDHPATRNALHPRMMVALADAAETLRGEPVILLRGEGGSFCSGGDLGAVRAHMTGAGRMLGTFMQETVATLCDGDAVVIGVAEGAAMGGGAELLAACDLVHAARDARVGFVHARLGVSPGFGGGARLVHKVGAHAAMRLLTEARLVPVAETGLATLVESDPLAGARARAEALRALDPAVLRGIKRIVRRGAATPEVYADELEVFAALWGGPAHLRALHR